LTHHWQIERFVTPEGCDLILPRSDKLDVFLGMRLNRLARAPARGVLRFARTKVGGQRRVTPLDADAAGWRARSGERD